MDSLGIFETGSDMRELTGSDMRELIDRETRDVRAAEAVVLFCYQVKKWIDAFAAALSAVDTLVRTRL